MDMNLYFRGTVIVKDYAEKFDSDLFARNEVRETVLNTLKKNGYKDSHITTFNLKTVTWSDEFINWPKRNFIVGYEGWCTNEINVRGGNHLLYSVIMSTFMNQNLFIVSNNMKLKIYGNVNDYEEDRFMGPESDKNWKFDMDMINETEKLSPIREVWIVEEQERWSKEIDDEDEPVIYDCSTMVVDIFDSKDKAIEGLLDYVKRTMENRKYGNDIRYRIYKKEVK